MNNTKIEWTEKVWNPITGCTKVSAGCKNCYAESIAKRFWGERKFTDIQLHEDRLDQPLKWKKPSMVFVNSMSDLFHEDVPFGFIDSVFATMGFAARHTFQILTKRPDRMKEYLEQSQTAWDVLPVADIWLGVSVEDQKTADQRIPVLLEIQANLRWVSVEPLLSKVNLPLNRWVKIGEKVKKNRIIDWVVIGCESGPSKRECLEEWIADIITDCRAFEIPVFVKQLNINNKVEKDISKFPYGLNVREYPKKRYENEKTINRLQSKWKILHS